MNKQKLIERTIRNYITSLVGVVIMSFSAIYFWRTLDEMTFENVLIGGALGAVGFAFLFVKDKLITSLFPRKNG